ncbi:hypothetical protein [Paenibacillus koleovorans]|uniref:hypothetical protein n=1 Tax=Paenibacillus koleovorans TaxID=121608 RepID=UPI000FD8DC71|nr:hypothetical protein [Paenibacillus koleovorans]
MRYKLIANERGAASLIYVLLVSMILLIMTPALLMAVSTDSTRISTDRHTQLATQLATSGIESFIAYLDKYNETTDGGREQYFNNYPGFITGKTFETPEGTPVVYKMERAKQGTTPLYRVTSSVEVGTGATKRTKTITYSFDSETVVTETHIDPDNRVPVPSNNQNIYAQGQTTTPPPGVPITSVPDIQYPIAETIAEYRSEVPPAPGAPEVPSAPIPCKNLSNNPCKNFQDVKEQIQALPGSDPIVLSINNWEWYNGVLNESWGTPQRPVILIFSGNTTFGGGSLVKLNLTGSIIVQGSFTINATNFELNINKSANGKYGDLYITQSITTENKSKINLTGGIMYAGTGPITIKGDGSELAAGYLYTNGNIELANRISVTVNSLIRSNKFTIKAGSSTVTAGSIYTTDEFLIENGVTVSVAGDINVENFELKGNSTIYSNKLIVNQQLQLYNDTKIHLTSDALVGSLQVHTNGQPGISAPAGDIFVENNVNAGNNITLVAGGVIAAGGNININNGHQGSTPSQIQSGGATTSLVLSNSGGSGGTSTKSGAWKPKRSG